MVRQASTLTQRLQTWRRCSRRWRSCHYSCTSWRAIRCADACGLVRLARTSRLSPAPAPRPGIPVVGVGGTKAVAEAATARAGARCGAHGPTRIPRPGQPREATCVCREPRPRGRRRSFHARRGCCAGARSASGSARCSRCSPRGARKRDRCALRSMRAALGFFLRGRRAGRGERAMWRRRRRSASCSASARGLQTRYTLVRRAPHGLRFGPTRCA
mmetsp:Transcript_21471/g.64220  ORF Transcript_21471/g.64220 Transcript_21471/m.64220 type:complete len:216 (-) Transcript_21471:2404-3051(-)